jgi:N-acetylmuramoyl-L-alanine amidase
MDIIQKYMTKNRCYSSPVTITVKKLVLHSLGVAQPDSDIIFNKMNTDSSRISVHGFIEADRIIQTLPWNYKGWHVGSGKKGSYNNFAIGIELCEPKGHTYNGGTMVDYNVSANKAYFTKVYNNAVQLFAMLSKELELDPLKDIVCHCEVYSLGYGSNHADVMQWFPRHKKTMDIFRADVRKEINSTKSAVMKKISSAKETELIQKQLI